MKNIYAIKTALSGTFLPIRFSGKLFRVICISLLIVIAAQAKLSAQVTWDNTSVGSSITTSPITVSHTTGTGSDRLMLVGVSTRDRTVSSVTYGGTALTLVGAQTSNGNAKTAIYRLIAPASGTANVVVTLSGNPGKGAVVGVMTFTGVNQTTPLGTYASAVGNSTTAALNVTSSNSELVFNVVSAQNVNVNNVAGQTQRWNVNTASENTGAGATKPGSATTSLSWTLVKDDWSMSGVSIKPLATADVQVTNTTLPALNPVLGTSFTFVATVKNNGPDAATNVTLNDLLPAGLTYSTHTASTGTYTSGTGVWTIGNLANQASATLSITATVSCSDKYTNTATVTATQPDPDTGNNTSIFTLTPQNTIATTYFICPGTTFNLGTLSPCNTPPETVVTWHTGTPATVDNEINNANLNVGAGTYYVAFHDETNVCWSPTTLFTVYEYPPIVVVPTNTTVSCYGGSDGALALNVSGGTAPYTYLWTASNGGVIPTGQTNSPNLSGLVAGNYSVTITDSKGCTINPLPYSVTQPAQLVVTPTITQPTCYSEGAVTLAVTGGTSPYTFDWADLAGTANGKDRSGLAPGTYSVTVTDANGCTVPSGNITITAPLNCDGVIVCNDETASEFSVAPDPDVTGYNWTVPAGATITSGQGTPAIKVNFTGVSPGAYQVCVVAQNVCGTSETTCRNVYVNQTVASAQADPVCVGGNLRLFANGGASYYWTGPNGFTSSSPNPVIYGVTAANSGTYTVYVTTAKGCTVSATVAVTVNTSFDVTGTVTNSACGVSTGAIDITPSPAGSYTYYWSNGVTSEDLTNVPSGTYTVRVSSATGCDVTKTFTISDTGGPTVTGAVTNISCPGSLTGAINITVTGGTGPYTYFWATTNGAGIVQGQEDQANLSAGDYSVVVTDAGGCKGTYSVSLTQPAPLNPDYTKTDVNCFGGNTGSINLTVTGGTPGYTFNWTTSNGSGLVQGQQDQSGLTAGTYNVTVTDANSCTASLSATITQPAAALSATAVPTAVSCFGDNNGQIVLTPTGGTAPYTYLWSNGATTQNITGLSAGTYSVTITDAKSCTYTLSSITVTQPAAALSPAGTQTNILCNGGNNGAIDLTVTGGTSGYTYAWSNGATTEDLTGLTAGTYSVVVTDANGCIASASFTITEPPVLTASALATAASCYGSATGSVTLTVSGGTGTLTYLWSNSSTDQDLTNVPAGYYSVTVTDANGCTTQTGATVTQPAAITVSGAVTNVVCHGDATGAININVSGGTGAYSYSWSNGATTQNISGLPVGTYTVTVKDANQCTTTADFVISETSNIVVGVLASNISCNGGSDGAITLNVSGGAEPYIYAWIATNSGVIPTGQVNSKDLTGLVAGTYTVTVTDHNNCSVSSSINITNPPVLTAATQDVTGTTCFNGTDGKATAVATGGTAPYTYVWSNGASGATATNLAPGINYVYITDSKGCTASAQVTITQPAEIKLYTTVRNTRGCEGTPTGAIDLTVENGVAPFTYVWSNSSTTEDLSGLAAGTYSVTVTDHTGCIATLSDITVGTAPALSASIETSVSSCQFNSGSAYAIVSGGVPPYSYSWVANSGSAVPAGQETSQFITGLFSGNYTVTVTDADGCTATASEILAAPVCNPPVAADDFYTISGDRFLTANASGNDSDPDNTLAELEFLPMTLPSAEEGTLIWSDEIQRLVYIHSGSRFLRYCSDTLYGGRSARIEG